MGHCRARLTRPALLGALTAALMIGCGGGEPDRGWRRIDDPGLPGGATDRSTTASPPGGAGGNSDVGSAGAPADVTAVPTAGVAAVPSAGDPDRPALEAEVEELLLAYDGAYAELAAAPLDALDDTSATVAPWHAVVAAGSPLDTHVRGQLWTDANDNRVLYLPNADDVLLSSHAQDIEAAPAGTVTWSNCVFTPWIETDADTGEVLDDRPFQRWGEGRAERDDSGGLVIVAVTEEQLLEVPPRAGDPCPAQRGDGEPAANEQAGLR